MSRPLRIEYPSRAGNEGGSRRVRERRGGTADLTKGRGKRGEEGSDGLDEEAMRYDVGGSSERV